MITVHCPPRTGSSGAAAAASGLGASGAAAHRLAMQRLVRALGGRVCGPRAAQVCVVCGGGGGGGTRSGGLPRELPAGARAVTEEWLLRLAETHEAPGDA